MSARMFISALMMAAVSFSASAATCDQLLVPGESYENIHRSSSLAWTGDFQLEATYACGSKVCFKGTMTFDNYSGGENLVTGEMSGSSITLRRYVDATGYTQTWKGTCKTASVSGTWVNDINAADTGSFNIFY